jgi:hypothetical protein
MIGLGKIRNYAKTLKWYFETLKKQNDELIWAKTWDDTKRTIPWAETLPSISPGRWAVGYNYLYVMTRILNEKEPHSVLDLGLGISSTLISAYFDFMKFDDGIHSIVEQSREWADFYAAKHRISKSSKIHVLDCVQKEFDGCKYNAYENFGNVTVTGGGGKNIRLFPSMARKVRKSIPGATFWNSFRKFWKKVL